MIFSMEDEIMESRTSLFDRFASLHNFRAAFRRVAVKNSRGGIDQQSTDDFAEKRDRNLGLLLDSIISGDYTPEPVAAVHIPKFNDAREWRELGLPTIADKVVQTALLQVAEPIAEKIFVNNSYGYRPGKGHYKAIRRVEHFISNEKRTWIVGHDVDNFFDTLNHDRLIRIWKMLISEDQRLADLVTLWCRMGIVSKRNKWKTISSGVRQGQVIAPLLANLYLHEFDLFVTGNDWGYVRYGDDFLILCREHRNAVATEAAARKFLADIHLRLNENRQPVFSLNQGFSFLGISFSGEKRTVAAKKQRKMKGRLNWLFNNPREKAIESLLEKIRTMLEGWLRYYAFLTPSDLFASVNQDIETSLAQWAEKNGVTGNMCKKLACPFLPVTFDAGRPALVFKPISPLLKIFKAKTEPAGNTGTVEKKIGKKRRQYRKKEVTSSELFVNTPGMFIGKRGGRIIVRQKQAIVAEVLVIHLKRLIIAGQGVTLSSDVVRLCSQENITLTFIDGLGRTYATASSPEGAFVELVLLQIRHRETEKGHHLACMFVLGKMKNQLSLLKSYRKYKTRHQGLFGQEFAVNRHKMESLIHQVQLIARSDHREKKEYRKSLMGLEGRFAHHYWKMVQLLIPDEVDFTGRITRGAKDLVNSMLNYGYGILYNHVLQAIHLNGLNSAAGFLHTDRDSKSALVYDLVEEFRPAVVDRAVFSLLNRRQKLIIGNDHLLAPESRKKLARAVIQRLGQEVKAKGKCDTLQHMIIQQARAVRRFLLDKSTYRPYLIKW
jgi:group II intron reverse transcriptase/maturase/CRISPR-associated endonuclease Cas1